MLLGVGMGSKAEQGGWPRQGSPSGSWPVFPGHPRFHKIQTTGGLSSAEYAAGGGAVTVEAGLKGGSRWTSGSPGTGGSMIVGRERERLLLDALLAAVPERGAALVLRGEPGVGKTALLDYAGSATGAMVVWVRGVESETVLPFAALADLLAPFVEQRRDLPDAQRSALEVCLAIADGAAPNPLAVCMGTLNVLATAAAVAPLVVLVDDLQWVDPPSQQVLLFVARRLSSERVAMVITVRPDFAELSEASGLPAVDVPGLPDVACRELLASRGIVASPEVAAELVRASSGNPLALMETARSLDAAQLRGERPMPELLPVGRQLRRAWGVRLDELPERTRQALVLLAASRSPAVGPLTSALRVSGLALSDLDPAEKAGLVTAAARTVQLRHPLLRSVVLEGASLSVRLYAYRVLAEVSTGDERVWYRAAAAGGCDEEIAAALVEVARRAQRRSGFGASARAWRRSAELTPDRRQRAERLLAAAVDAHLGGLPHDAAARCEQAARLADDPLLRADVELVHGRVLTWIGDLKGARDQLVGASRAVREFDLARASALLAEAIMPVTMNGEVTSGLRLAEECVALAAEIPGSSIPTSLFLGHMRTVAGQVSQGRKLLDAAGASLAEADPVAAQHMMALYGACHIWLEDDDRARALLTKVVEAARRYGAPVQLGYALGARSELDWWAGRWAAGRADATEALRWAQDLRQPATVGVTLAYLARLEAVRGDLASCEEHIEQARRDSGQFGIGCLPIYTDSVLGLAALGHGEHDAAVSHLERARELAADGGLANPNVVPLAGDLVEAHIRAGNRERAEEALGWLEESARATGLAWPVTASARCRILLAPGTEAADSSFTVAEAAHQRRDMPFEYARTQLCYGETLRRLRRPAVARAPLLAAHATFQTLGARPWAARAAAELAAAGGRPITQSSASPLDQLTPQELQTARAIAEGRTNTEAATALFISRKTVETHLTRIYRKLGIRSRTELTRTLISHGLGEDGVDGTRPTSQPRP